MMPRGREPEGEVPLSNAARQARYRARHKEKPDSLRDTATAEALQAIVDLDLEGLGWD
jgi:hypothetical protein